MRVLFLGELDDGRSPSSQTAELLAGRSIDVAFDSGAWWSESRWREMLRACDCVHLVWYDRLDGNLARKLVMARLLGKGVVRQWVGSDVLWAVHCQRMTMFSRQLGRIGVLHATVSSGLKSRLGTVGIHAESLPVPAARVFPDAALRERPDRATVLAYLPGKRREFYGSAVIGRMARLFPDVRFLIVGHDGVGTFQFPNVEWLGVCDDMESAYRRATILLRPSLHDGMPKMVLEALARGLFVIGPHEWAACERATGVAETAEALRRLIRVDGPNKSGMGHVLEAHSAETTAEAWISLMNRACNHGTVWRNAASLARFWFRWPIEGVFASVDECGADAEELRCAQGGPLPRMVQEEIEEWDRRRASA